MNHKEESGHTEEKPGFDLKKISVEKEISKSNKTWMFIIISIKNYIKYKLKVQLGCDGEMHMT